MGGSLIALDGLLRHPCVWHEIESQRVIQVGVPGFVQISVPERCATRTVRLFSKGLGYHTLVPQKQAATHTPTGFAKDEIIDLCALVYANEENSQRIRGRGSSATSGYSAHLHAGETAFQQGNCETFNISQSTISRA